MDFDLCLEFVKFSSKKNRRVWAKRMSHLKKTRFGSIPDSCFGYFKEANECYVYGCFNGAIALAGTAIELALKEKLAKKKVVAPSKFDELNRLCLKKKVLNRENFELAESIRTARNNFVHCNSERIFWEAKHRFQSNSKKEAVELAKSGKSLLEPEKALEILTHTNNLLQELFPPKKKFAKPKQAR